MWQSLWQCDNASKLTVIVTRTKFLFSSAIMLLCGLYIYQLWLSGWEDCPTFHIGFNLWSWQRALLLTMIQLSSHSTKQLSFNLSVATGACFKSSSYSRAESYVATSHPPCITNSDPRASQSLNCLWQPTEKLFYTTGRNMKHISWEWQHVNQDMTHHVGHKYGCHTFFPALEVYWSLFRYWL